MVRINLVNSKKLRTLRKVHVTLWSNFGLETADYKLDHEPNEGLVASIVKDIRQIESDTDLPTIRYTMNTSHYLSLAYHKITD